MAKIENSDPNAKALLIKGAVGQVEDILDIQDSDGNSFLRVQNDGSVNIDGVGDINFIMDGGGFAIVPGSHGFLEIPFSGTITGWTILADREGSVVVDVKRSTYSNFPTTASIAGTEKPTLSSAQKNQDLTLTTWTTIIAAGDVLEYVVDSAALVTRVTVGIKISRSY